MTMLLVAISIPVVLLGIFVLMPETKAERRWRDRWCDTAKAFGFECRRRGVLRQISMSGTLNSARMEFDNMGATPLAPRSGRSVRFRVTPATVLPLSVHRRGASFFARVPDRLRKQHKATRTGDFEFDELIALRCRDSAIVDLLDEEARELLRTLIVEHHGDIASGKILGITDCDQSTEDFMEFVRLLGRVVEMFQRSSEIL